ncbi:RNase H domain-containing protein [Trichonephila clavipes]|nr:RNase H domain-containing protein [Trichonephila clavipes]
MQEFLRHRTLIGSCANHGGVLPGPSQKGTKNTWGIFRRYPTIKNLIALKRAKALARKIRAVVSDNLGCSMSLQSHRPLSIKLWRKVKAANGLYRNFTFPILETSTAVYSSPTDVANLIGEAFVSVSSSNFYNATFLENKNRSKRTPINFSCQQFLPYNCDFPMRLLKRVLCHRPTILVQDLIEYLTKCFVT